MSFVSLFCAHRALIRIPLVVVRRTHSALFLEHLLCAGHCAGAGLSDEDVCHGSYLWGLYGLGIGISCWLF